MSTSKQSSKKIDAKQYWDEVYQNKDDKTLGWYQEIAQPSLDLFKEFKIRKSRKILIVGSGTTRFVDNLLSKGYKNIIATDISKIALMNLENRVASHQHKNLPKRISFIEDDLRNPKSLTKLEKIDVWHDRAVFHYFTDKEEQASYLKLLKSLVKKKGYVLIAVYNKKSPKVSTGLDIINYDATEISRVLGPDFKLMKTHDYDFKQPSGNVRHYVYTMFKRINVTVAPLKV